MLKQHKAGRKQFLLLMIFVFFGVSATSLINAVTCDLGSLSTTCVINRTQDYVHNENITGSGNLVIDGTGRLQNSEGQDLLINMSGNVTIEIGGVINADASSVSVGDGVRGGDLTIYGDHVFVQGTISSTGGETSWFPAKGGRGGYLSIDADIVNVTNTITMDGGNAPDGDGNTGGHIFINATEIYIPSSVTLSTNGGNGDINTCEPNDAIGHVGDGGIINFTTGDFLKLDGTLNAVMGTSGKCNDGTNGTIHAYYRGLVDVDGATFNPNVSLRPLVGINETYITEFGLLSREGKTGVFWFVLTNIAGETYEHLWSVDTGETLIGAENRTSLSASDSLFVFFENSYSSLGAYVVSANAYAANLTDTDTISITLNPIEIGNLTSVYQDGNRNVFEIEIRNGIENNLSSVDWTFDTGDDQIINSTENIDLASNDNMFIYVDYNFSSSGTYNVNTTVQNGTLSHSLNLTIVV